MLRQLFIVLNAGGLADWTSQLAAPAARAPVPIVLLVPCLSAPLAHAAVPVVIGVSDLPARAAGTATPIVLSPTQRPGFTHHNRIFWKSGRTLRLRLVQYSRVGV